MADGDEKIDYNDRVLILNRVTDGPTEVMFDGKVLVWKAGEIRSIQRLEAPQVVNKSNVKRCPMFSYYPINRLVIVDEMKQAVEDGASTGPLTVAECKELAKFGSLDTANLPPDRLIGGQVLMDRETGQYPDKIETRIAPQGGGNVGGNLPQQNRAATSAALDSV